MTYDHGFMQSWLNLNICEENKKNTFIVQSNGTEKESFS